VENGYVAMIVRSGDNDGTVRRIF